MSNTEATKLSDWDLVCACLHYSGTVKVSDEVWLEARLLCDGMGTLTKGNLDPVDAYPASDWSHVRDSSPEAVARCAAYLREQLAS